MVKKIDLLLVNPIAKKRVYQELSKDYSANEPPFWAALTAGFIRKKGFKTDILDTNLENLDSKESAEEINKINPKFLKIIGTGQQPSASTQLMTGVGELCKEKKKINPN